MSSSRIFIWLAGIRLDRLLNHLPDKSRAECARLTNPKSEVRTEAAGRHQTIRNKLKIRMREYFKRSEGLFSFSAILIFHQLFRFSRFEIRVSRRRAWFRLRRVGQHSALRTPDFSFA
jgi:hypothetical protein